MGTAWEQLAVVGLTLPGPAEGLVVKLVLGTLCKVYNEESFNRTSILSIFLMLNWFAVSLIFLMMLPRRLKVRNPYVAAPATIHTLLNWCCKVTHFCTVFIRI